MNTLWAHWRSEYITRPKDVSCVFCTAPQGEDPLILKKSKSCFAIMNRFPYTTGHCLVAPNRHVGDIAEVSQKEFSEIISLVKEIVSAVRKAMNPDGFNVGCNIGAVAGAGIADHFHVHIVPRWSGDTNFMPVISDSHIISEHILVTRDKIAKQLSGAQ